MKSLLHAGAAVQQDFVRRAWRFAFIGGVANFRWGTPRLTNDLDLTLLTGFGGEAEYVIWVAVSRWAQSKWIRKIHRISVGKPVQVQPTANPIGSSCVNRPVDVL